MLFWFRVISLPLVARMCFRVDGFPAGDDAGRQESVYGPDFALALNLEVSFSFVYVGGGFTHLEKFKPRQPTRCLKLFTRRLRQKRCLQPY